MPLGSSTYSPPSFLSGGHVQTLFASLLRRVDFDYDHRERIETPDDDFLDLDWATACRSDREMSDGSEHVAVLVHGLEGAADRPYMRGMARALVRRGWDVCALNLRGCSGEVNRRLGTYHSGKTDDLALVVHHVLDRGYTSVALVGFSLGGNIVLKFLGERGANADSRLQSSAVFSVPVDLKASSHKLGRLRNWHYTQYFLRSLRQKVRGKAKQYPDRVDTSSLADIATLRDFDDTYTAAHHDFDGADDYYRRASSKPLLDNIDVPTLLVNAANDPFLPPSCYPRSIARSHEHLVLEVPDSGGHVGFVSFTGTGEYWSEERTAKFLGAAAASPDADDAPRTVLSSQS